MFETTWLIKRFNNWTVWNLIRSMKRTRTNMNIQENNNNNNRSERYEDDFDKRKEAYLVSQAFRQPIWRGRNEPSRDSGLRLWKAPWDSSSRDSHKCLSRWCKSSPPLSRTEPPLSMPSPIFFCLFLRSNPWEIRNKIQTGSLVLCPNNITFSRTSPFP